MERLYITDNDTRKQQELIHKKKALEIDLEKINKEIENFTNGLKITETEAETPFKDLPLKKQAEILSYTEDLADYFLEEQYNWQGQIEQVNYNKTLRDFEKDNFISIEVL